MPDPRIKNYDSLSCSAWAERASEREEPSDLAFGLWCKIFINVLFWHYRVKWSPVNGLSRHKLSFFVLVLSTFSWFKTWINKTHNTWCIAGGYGHGPDHPARARACKRTWHGGESDGSHPRRRAPCIRARVTARGDGTRSSRSLRHAHVVLLARTHHATYHASNIL